MVCFDINNLEVQLLLVLIILITTWFLIVYLERPKNLPPGPWGIPHFGYKLFLGAKPHITVANMRKQYGDLIRINMGTGEAIFLNSFKAIKAALVNQADIFAGRPLRHPVNPKDPQGIVMSNGAAWTEIRRFSLSTMRDFGFGKSSLEPQIKDEIHYFLEEIKSFKGQTIPDMGEHIRKSVTNVICVLISGKRFDYQDEMFNKLLVLSNEVIRLSGGSTATALIPKCLHFPFLLKFFGVRSSYPAYFEMKKTLQKFVEKRAEMHSEAMNENSFIDVWLTESLNTNTQFKHVTKIQLPMVLFDLFAAGSDTTTNTLGWSLLYMIEHADTQAKVQQEIEDVIGSERTPSMTDQKSMPFTEAVLMEVNRIVTIVPLSVTHRSLSETTLLGKFIPSGMTIIPNLWAAHHDPELFPEPFKFKPERFLTDDRQVKRFEEFVPFSMGKRQCMGESLVRMELFLYFTSMLQHFTFKRVNDTIDFDYHYSVVTMPKVQPICAVPR